MTNFSDIRIPSQLRPELAKMIAERLCWASANSPIVSFTALVLMYVSWTADKPLTLVEVLNGMAKAFADEKPVLEVLANESLYGRFADNPKIGGLTTVHAQQATRIWSNRLKKSQLDDLRGCVETTLTAAFADGSERGIALAENIQEVIDSFRSPDDTELEEGGLGFLSVAGLPDIPKGAAVMLSTPNGPAGPFKSKAEITSFIAKSLAGLRNGQGNPAFAIRDSALEEKAGEPESQPGSTPGLTLYRQGDVITVLQRLPPPMPGEGNLQQHRVLQEMANDNGWREFTMVPKEAVLAELYETFPHFKPVLDFVKQNLALAGCGNEGQPVRVPPILLRGVPGTGKTFFAQELARVLGTTFVERDLSVTSEAFVLVGMDSTWKGSKPGIVLDTLVNGKTANPLICLNEVDKASGRGSHNSPIAALYTLLEPTSANRFKDEFIPVELDTSRVLWVLTANEGEIPAPILERTEDFRIPEPTQEQCRAIAVSVWKNICQRDFPQGHGFAAELGEPLLKAVSAMRPRVMRKTLTHAASMAALAGRKFLTLEDLATSQKRYDRATSNGIGFSADIH